MADFYSDLARGRQGEVLVANAFRNMGYKVTDVTKIESYQKFIIFIKTSPSVSEAQRLLSLR